MLFIATGSPFSKIIFISSGLSGASNREVVRLYTYSGASNHGSSNTLPSEEVCNKLASVLKGGSPFLSLGIGIWYF